MKKIIFTILTITTLFCNQFQSLAQIGTDEWELSGMTVIQDKGKYDNLLLDCTSDFGWINHNYHGNAGYSKNVEIYVQAGWTVEYRRRGDYYKGWWSGNNPNYVSLIIIDDDNVQYILPANDDTSDGTWHKNEKKRAWFKFIDSGSNSVKNVPAAEVQDGRVRSQIATIAYDNPVDVRVIVKTYGFKLLYHANGQQYGDRVDLWYYDKTNTIPIGVSTNPSKEGYTFKGWNTTGESFSNQGTIVSQVELTNNQFYVTLYAKNASEESRPELLPYPFTVQNLYAQWEATPYTITYNANGGSCSISSETYTIESATRNTPTPTRWGYDFKGWKVTSAEKNWTLNDVYGVDIKQLAQGLYGNVTLEAQWAIKTFPVVTTFSAGKGTSSADQIIVYNQNSSAVTIEAAKNYRITSVKVVMSIDGTDVEKINQTYNPSTNPVSSYTIPSMKIEGSTTVTVTTERVSADVTLSKQNLTANDCSIIKVSGGDKSYTVILTQSNKSVTLNEVPLGTYSITETNWSYTYEKSSSSVPSSFTIANTDTDDKSYEFNGAKKTSDRFSAESYKSN